MLKFLPMAEHRTHVPENMQYHEKLCHTTPSTRARIQKLMSKHMHIHNELKSGHLYRNVTGHYLIRLTSDWGELPASLICPDISWLSTWHSFSWILSINPLKWGFPKKKRQWNSVTCGLLCRRIVPVSLFWLGEEEFCFLWFASEGKEEPAGDGNRIRSKERETLCLGPPKLL